MYHAKEWRRANVVLGQIPLPVPIPVRDLPSAEGPLTIAIRSEPFAVSVRNMIPDQETP